jgi:hypothetical protein
MQEFMDIETETTVSYNKRKIENHFEEPYNQPRKSMRRENQPFTRLSQDEYLQKEIDKKLSEGEKFLEELPDKRDNASTDNYDKNNKDVAQQSNDNETSNTENMGGPPPVHSRFRKKKNSNKSKSKKPVNVQDDKGYSKYNSNLCGCLPIVELPCNCSKSLKNQDENFDYEMIINEDIPDKKPPLNPKKAKKQSIIKKFTKAIYNYINYMVYGYESDEQSNDDISNQTISVPSCLINAINNFFFDPLAPNDPPSTIHSYSNAHINGSSNSTATFSIKCESHGCSSSNWNSVNSYNINNIWEGRHDLLSMERVSQHMDPQSPHLLVIFIAFDCYIERPNFDNCHSLGYHPILRRFGDPIIHGNDALHFVHDSIMNCWANSWKVALVVSGETKKLSHFFTKIRENFESEILDIIFIQLFESPCRFSPRDIFNRLDISVAKDSNTVTWKQEYDKIMKKVIQKVTC